MWQREKDVKNFLHSLCIDTSKRACDYFIMSILIAASGTNVSGDADEILRQVASWYGKQEDEVRREVEAFVNANAISKRLFSGNRNFDCVLREVAGKLAQGKI